MRSLFALPLITLVVLVVGPGVEASAQTCTGLCLQQVSCPGGGTTSISGTVLAPNGVDPLPNVLVYIPNAAVDPFTAGVSCPVVGQTPPGSPLVGTTTAVDGSFTLTNVPVGSSLPLVIQSGRWRRQLVVPGTVACTNTTFSTRMPKNQSEGDIPKIAIATGRADQVECVLRKVGLEDAEFTDPGGTGRINLFSGSGSPGARIGTATPSEGALMGNASVLNGYDVLMLPCEGGQFLKPTAELGNLIRFADSGGRVYASHFSYVWMFQNPPFMGVANWKVNQAQLPDGIATVDATFPDGATLAQWLQLVGATTTLGQMPISTLRHDMNGVIAPTQSWLALNNSAAGNPVMQFVFDTPVGTTANQCGRVLFNEYHVEDPGTNSPANKAFPTECSAGAMTPQEKLLEYSLFALTNDGGAPTLTPVAQDFGSQPVGFNTAPQIFVWKNSSTFPASVTTLAATGDFAVTSNNCGSVGAGGSCQINVVFNPTVLGVRTGTLTVGSNGSKLTAALTGIGIPDLMVSATSLNYGSLDVGASSSKVLTVTNNASGTVAVPGFVTTGDYAATSTCGGAIGALASCTLTVTFTPTTTGTRSGSLAASPAIPAYAGIPAVLTGNGVDFSFVAIPSSGSVIAGNSAVTSVVTTPLAGFAAAVSLHCTTTMPASTCTPAVATFIPTISVTTAVNITTTSQYTVVGYGGFGGGGGLLWLVGAGSGWLVWIRRRSQGNLGRLGLIVFLLTAAAFSMVGCSGKYPDRNATYTPPGSYTVTLTATDGTLVHSATYTLNVTGH